jgi:ferrous iron transport protein B
VVDLPGTYSLAPRSLDEIVTVDLLLGRRSDAAQPDVIVCIVDATNLERNLYLVSQALELGRPLVLVLNKVDMLADQGIEIDVPALRRRLGIPIIQTQAHRRIGLDELKEVLVACRAGPPKSFDRPLPAPVYEEIDALKRHLDDGAQGPVPYYLVERLLLDTAGYLQKAEFAAADPQLPGRVEAARKRLAEIGHPIPAVETSSRYRWVDNLLEGVVEHGDQERVTVTDRIDSILTHRWLGGLIFVLLMVIVFSRPLSRWLPRAVKRSLR